MSLNSALKDHLESTVFNLKLHENPYFKMLCSGAMSKGQFLQSQIEFAPLVQFFNRPMAQVIANIPDAILRIALVDNLWEEHGKGVPEKVHGKTILTLIDRLGGDSAKVDQSRPSSNVRIFNEALRGASAFEGYRFAAAMFGGIERTFVEVSSMIFQSIVDQSWLPADKVTHYGLHKELDIQHAEDFLMVVNQDWHDPIHQREIKDGVQFGASLFANVYTGFYHNITRS
ncbi:TenA family transcriptional regulator [Burkholderia multivorans]|uniref:TenA family transcriptional regulator n=1 Tax=Burkholderia multivorans TaxID=87883 RepID=UPI0009BDE240|nr:iron-containing redox enzyme family protein [Burkholderia multivorans]